MNEGKIIAKLRSDLEEAKRKRAEAGYTAPKKELFDHGFEVGVYHGLQQAESILEALLRSEDN